MGEALISVLARRGTPLRATALEQGLVDRPWHVSDKQDLRGNALGLPEERV